MKHNHRDNEHKTLWVVLLTAITMVAEIVSGLMTHSMALLADGIHMGSHVLAIGLSWLAYFYIRKYSNKQKNNFKSDKVLSLSGFSSGLMLLIFALVIFIEAIGRILNPMQIQYQEAIFIAIAGLLINILCAFLLKHDHEHSDNNIKAAYIHVLSDALTSVTAIIGLTAAMLWNLLYLDAIGAILSSIIIVRWAIMLIRDSGKVLIELK